MKDKIFCLVIILFTLSNCESNIEKNHSKTIKVDINNNLNKLSHLEIGEIIKLESSPEAFFGKTAKVMSLDDRYYFIDKRSTKALFAFDRNGRFLNKTTIGKGPGEVLSPVDFTLIKGEQSRVLMYDQFGGNFLEFNRDLELIDEGPNLHELTLSNFYMMAADSFLVYCHTPTKAERESPYMNVYSIYTKNFSKKKELNVSTVIGKGVMFLDNAIVKVENRLLFIAPFDYSIYELKGGDCVRIYQVDFGKQSLKQEDFLEMNYGEISKLEKQGQKIGTLWSIFGNESFLVFGFYYKREATYILYSLDNDRVYNLNENFKIHNLPLTRIVGVNEGGKLIGLIEPEDFIESKASNQKYDFSMELEDNPLIVLLNIRE